LPAPRSDAIDSPDPPALSILIATPGRIESLREVLSCLAQNKASERYEVVVIDNACEPPLTAAEFATPGLGSLRFLREMQRGKSHAINRALDEDGLGEIIAVIDDDMSPGADWIEGVLSASRRLPQFDVFSGKSYVIWPTGVAKPAWAGEPLAQGLLFSVFDSGSSGDIEMGVGALRFPSGNHFWFRRSVLAGGARLPPVWAHEMHFVVALRALGHRGVFVPEAVIGHRIQKELVDPRKFLERACRFGRDLAELDAIFPAHPTKGNLARVRSCLRPLRTLAQLGAWSIAWLLAGLRPESKRLPARARALWGIAYCKARLNPSLGKAR
jgi:glycosyltransferase involved in cell wall biosynthesis